MSPRYSLSIPPSLCNARAELRMLYTEHHVSGGMNMMGQGTVMLKLRTENPSTITYLTPDLRQR
eukprot:956017-Rhodomonas_salina.2